MGYTGMPELDDVMDAVKAAEAAAKQAQADLEAKKQLLLQMLQGEIVPTLTEMPKKKPGRPKTAITGRSFRTIALEVLEDEGPMGIKDLTEEAIKRGWKTTSNDPTNTTYQTLLGMRKKREVSLDDGLYSLVGK